MNDQQLDRDAQRPARRRRSAAPMSVLRQIAGTRALIDGSRNAALADFTALGR